MTEPNPAQNAPQLATAYAALVADKGPLRIRDAAEELGASELELLIALPSEQGIVTRLDLDAVTLYAALPEFGEVMTLVRNDVVVHEKTGTFGELEKTGHIGLVMHDQIDLRLFFRRWRHFVAVEKEHAGATLCSVQIFDAHGGAVQKIYARSPKARARWGKLVAAHAADEHVDLAIQPEKKKTDEVPADFDGVAFRARWLGMKDTHDFFGICMKHGITRHRALLEAPEGHAVQVQVEAFIDVFESAKETALPIMVFAGNPGAIQIHTGTVSKLAWRGTWFNVLDPNFNLHVQTELIDQCWIVRKPTEDGIVTSLEAYDRDGTIVAYLFGERKPGIPELDSWTELIAGIETRFATLAD